jgi:hypothetical protein
VRPRSSFTMSRMDLKTKLLIALILLVAVAGLSLSFLISFTATPAN